MATGWPMQPADRLGTYSKMEERMKKMMIFGSVLVALGLVAGFNSGCGGSDSSSSPSATTVVTNGSVVVTNVTPVATLDGSWNGSLNPGGGFSLHLTQNNDAVTGTITYSSYTENITGNISGDAINLMWSHTTTGSGPGLHLILTTSYNLSGNANSSRNNMAGSFTESIFGAVTTNGTWSASK